jgi:hypothetical protein
MDGTKEHVGKKKEYYFTTESESSGYWWPQLLDWFLVSLPLRLYYASRQCNPTDVHRLQKSGPLEAFIVNVSRKTPIAALCY